MKCFIREMNINKKNECYKFIDIIAEKVINAVDRIKKNKCWYSSLHKTLEIVYLLNRIYKGFIMKKFFKLSILVLLASLFFNNQEAQAYINPGSGSYIFQTIIGGFLSIFYFVKKIFKSLFIKKDREQG